MRARNYHKLVRDRIPEIYEGRRTAGLTAETQNSIFAKGGYTFRMPKNME